jgi:hypothetical protein
LIGRAGPAAWSPPSPDFMPLHVFFGAMWKTWCAAKDHRWNFGCYQCHVTARLARAGVYVRCMKRHRWSSFWSLSFLKALPLVCKHNFFDLWIKYYNFHP